MSIGNSEVEQAVGSYKQFAAEVVRILEVGSSSAGAGTAVVVLRILQDNPMVDNQT